LGVRYVASKDGTVTKLEDGKLVWKVSAGQSLSAGVGANGRLVVVATSKGDVLAFSTEDGKSLWQTKVSSEVLAAPVVGDEGVAVKSGDNRVHLLDAGDGGKMGISAFDATPVGSQYRGPVFADRYLFVGYPGGKLVALSVQNGAPVWEGR
jgi:outer membrane protein assembly factor BamB